MNPQRGEIGLMIDGEERRLCLTLGALAEIEAALGCHSLKDLTVRLKAVSAADLIKVLAALLRGGGEADLAMRVGELQLSPKRAMQAVLTCFARATS